MTFRTNIAGQRPNQKQIAKDNQCPKCLRKSSVKLTFEHRKQGLVSIEKCRWCDYVKEDLLTQKNSRK